VTGAVLTAGETMALLDPADDGPPRSGTPYVLRAAGAESNFAVALARLEVEARWASRVGDDALGMMVRNTLGDEGLDLSLVTVDPEAPTGVYLKHRARGSTTVDYYRSGSAASRLSPGDVPDAALDGVDLVHLTGITLALSASCRAFVLDLARRARERGIAVQFDPNYRPALWASPAAAAEAQRPLLGLVDWYLCGSGEASLLFGPGDERELVASMRAAGIERGVVRAESVGALVFTSENIVEVQPPRRERSVLDEVGAGDAFAAGFALGLLRGWTPEVCARAGHVIAAHALRGTGDWETLPRLDEVAAQLGT
jgi:2-dehydro-3-deoxygluconokinase